jgi:hypothetical protein
VHKVPAGTSTSLPSTVSFVLRLVLQIDVSVIEYLVMFLAISQPTQRVRCINLANDKVAGTFVSHVSGREIFSLYISS